MLTPNGPFALSLSKGGGPGAGESSPHFVATS